MSSKANPVSAQLRQTIRSCGLSRYAISKATGVSQSVLSRFMSGKFNLSLANVDRLAEFLGLTLTQRHKTKRRKGR